MRKTKGGEKRRDLTVGLRLLSIVWRKRGDEDRMRGEKKQEMTRSYRKARGRKGRNDETLWCRAGIILLG